MRPKSLSRVFGGHLLTRLVLVGIISIIILIGVFILLGKNALQKTTHQALEDRVLLTRQIAANLDFALSSSLDWIEESLKAHDINRQESVSESTALLALRQARASSLISLSSISLITPGGSVLATDPLVPESSRAQKINHAMIQEMLLTGKPVISAAAEISPDNQAVLYLTIPVRAGGKIAAAVQGVIDLPNSNLAHFIQTVKTGRSEYAQIVDSKGVVLASTKPYGILEKGDHGDQFAHLISRGKTTAGTCHSCHESPVGSQKEREALAFAPLTRVSWGIAIREPERDVLSQTRLLQARLVLLGFVSLFALTGLGWLFYRNVVRPLAQLDTAALRIGGGNLNEPIQTFGQGEIADLSSTLESMRKQLQTSYQQLQQWNRELEERVQYRTKELSSLVKASQTLVSNLDPKNIFTNIIGTAVNTFRHADAGILFLYDQTTDRLIPTASVGYDANILSSVRLRPGEAIAGRAFQQRQPLLSNKPLDAARELQDISPENRRLLAEARRNLEIQCYISCPLEIDNRVLGSLILVGLRQGSAFSQLELELTMAFSNLAAALLQKMTLLDEANRAEILRKTDELKMEFLSNVSHELQTPLATLKASLDFVLAGDTRGLNEAQTRLILNANRSADHLSKLISDLMDIAKLQGGHMPLKRKPLDLRDVVTSVSDTFKPLLASKKQAFQVNIPSSPLMVTGDQRRLEQILNNLVSNAHYYTPDGGRISIMSYEHEELAIVSVSDTGPGIAADRRHLIFQRFYREEKGNGTPTRGMGLGLSIARGLAELHNGRLLVNSEPGKGSTFILEIPKGREDENTDC